MRSPLVSSALLGAVGIALLYAKAGVAQSSSNGTRPEFEAASIKAQKSNPIDPLRPESVATALPVMRGGPGTSSPGRIHFSNVTLMSLLTKAYDINGDQVQGPDWLTHDRFAVDAVIPAGSTEEQFRQMLQNLIVERFDLTFRWEEREFKIYRLVAAKGGPKVKPSAVASEEDDYDLATVRAIAAKAAAGPNGCPVLDPSRHAASSRGTCMTYVGWSMAEFAQKTLSVAVGSETGGAPWAHVVDETGLSGRFDFTLDYNLAYHLMASRPGLAPTEGSNTVSIFKAVEAQLGLRVEPSTAKLRVMVIRQAERIPKDN